MWLKTVKGIAPALALFTLVPLTACGDQPQATEPPAAPLPPSAEVDAKVPTPPAVVSPPAGLAPLPTRQAVVGSMSLGRRDPFGSLPRPIWALAPSAGSSATPGAKPGSGAPAQRRGASPPAALRLPPDFRLTGVIRSGGVSEAVVQYRNLTGNLRPGDRGGHSTDLLPSGWRVASINVEGGRLVLQKANRLVTAEI